MKKGLQIILGLILLIAVVVPAYADDAELAAKIDAVVSKGPDNTNYFVGADDIYMWLKMKKTDFFVVDVRADADAATRFKEAHIPGAIHIPYNQMFKPENLKKLPKDKKIILVCNVGVTEGLGIVPLRMLGYDAYGLLIGMAGWQKDFFAADYIRGLLDAPKAKNYPVESTK